MSENPVSLSPAGLGFLPHCSGLLSQPASFYRLVTAFALQNCPKLLHGEPLTDAAFAQWVVFIHVSL